MNGPLNRPLNRPLNHPLNRSLDTIPPPARQVPFQGRLVMQPSTVQGSETIEWGGFPTAGAQQAYRQSGPPVGYHPVPAHRATHAPQPIMRQQAQSQQQRRAPPQTVQPPRPAPIQQPAQSQGGAAPKLSKAQKAKLRKAKREGKV